MFFLGDLLAEVFLRFGFFILKNIWSCGILWYFCYMNTKETKSVRVNIKTVEMLTEIKKELGFPIARFIEEAVYDKAIKLPKKMREKLGFQDF